jgi:flagellar hook assembly protein FlgD
VTVNYQVADKLSPSASVSLRIRNAVGKTVKTISLGEQDTGKVLTYLWKCPLGKGKYKYSILATDLAGNKASKTGTNTLTVR